MAGEFNRTKLMWASFLTLIASGFGFATRTAAGGIWEREFGIDGSGFGQILGAGFLGFGMAHGNHFTAAAASCAVHQP